jgi:GNAT superfamily N-acetyltransferase
VRIDARYAACHRLADGTTIRIRLLRPDDRDRLREGFARLSSRSRYLRFLSATPRLTEHMLDYLTQCDGDDHLAVGAEVVEPAGRAGEGLGVARFVRLAGTPDVAEAAVAVVDAAQERGIGRLLLETLSEAARERGIRAFRAFVLPGNAGARALIEELTPHAGAPRREDGALVYDLPLLPADVPDTARRASPLYRLLRSAAAGLEVVARALAVERPADGGR